MVVSDWVYYRVPRFWFILGIGFVLLALAAGPDFQYFLVSLLVGLVCLLRSLQIYQLRREVNRRRRMTVLTETQKLDRYDAAR
jgi:Flp pilus assembly protein protease CpaA